VNIAEEGDNDGDDDDVDTTPMFAVIEGLGRGGYSTVVKAQHVLTRKCYAMKVIPKNVSDNPLRRENHKAQIKFELEVMTEVVSSPFLQKCKYAFESSNSVFFVLDLNTGGDLFYHLVRRIESGNRFSENECRVLLAEIFLALEHLHVHDIIHRDIKIENIMLNASGHVKLVDFGLAVELKEDVQGMNGAGSLIYMAPELIRDRIGGRFTDWWAYGVLSHELLTGKTPWSSLTDSRLIKGEILNKAVLPPFHLSKVASTFIVSLLTKDPSARLGTKADDELRKSSFFTDVNWEAMARLECAPAFVPSAINVNKEDQDEALDAFHEVITETSENDSLTTNQWMLGLPSYSNFLI
jgi:serine/threonine protein kinase